MIEYDSYKDSGAAWIGKIPGHWEVRKLRNFLKFISIKGHGGKPLLSVTREQGVILRNVESKEENHNFIPEDLNGYKLVMPGQFVINKMKSWQGSYGVSNYEGIVSPAYYVCDLSFPCKTYFSIAIRSNAYVPFFTQFSKGIRVDQWDLSPYGLKSIPFVVPPLPEQQAVVDYLKIKTSKIEQYVTERERELLESLKQSEIANVVTKGLNPNTPMKDSSIPWIGLIPEHWETRKIKFLFKERSEKGYPNEPVLCATQKYGVIPQAMYENRVVVVNKGLEGLKLVKEGDFVISLRSFQGGIEYAYYQGIISAAYTILTPSQEVNVNYIKYLFKSHPFIGLLQTCVTGIREGQNINYDLLRKSSIMLPPLSEQQAIVDYIDNKLAKINSCIADLQAEIDYLKEFKQRLISDTVTGQICVAEPQKGDVQ